MVNKRLARFHRLLLNRIAGIVNGGQNRGAYLLTLKEGVPSTPPPPPPTPHPPTPPPSAIHHQDMILAI